MQQVDAAGRFGQIPLVDLTAYHEAPIPRGDWLALQAKYAAHSSNSRNLIAVHSAHFIMNMETELIGAAIRWIIEQVNSTE